MSLAEERICSQEFSYLQPYFYNHPYGLRCELGQGDAHEAYMATALRRALELYDILFPKGADAICFNYWLQDDCDSGPAEQDDCDETMEENLAHALEVEAKKYRFLRENQFRYRHVTVRNLPTYDEPGDPDCELIRRNRVVCFSDGKGFDHEALLRNEIFWEGYEVSFISFENECIFSVYDDRGCDIVFMTREKLREFYHKLEPYFLDYDWEEMERRFCTNS
jgi:hypothetical protein